MPILTEDQIRSFERQLADCYSEPMQPTEVADRALRIAAQLLSVAREQNRTRSTSVPTPRLGRLQKAA